MNALQIIKQHLEPGHVYRRSDVSRWSNAPDRHLGQLQAAKILTKLRGGLYYYPEQGSFGSIPPSDNILVEAFLKDHRFLLMNYSSYNSLNVGTTQLYTNTIVYNHKRHGTFTLGSRDFVFVVKPHFPLEINEEFLLVDLVDTLPKLAEDQQKILEYAQKKALAMDANSLIQIVQRYGGARSRKFFGKLFGSPEGFKGA